MQEIQPLAIGKNIMNYRKVKNMSLEELSKRSGVSKSMLSQIEQEKTNPTVVTVWKIARALNVTVEEIIESNADYQIEVIRRDEAPLIYSEDESCVIRIDSPIHMSDNLELYHMRFKAFGKINSAPHYPKVEEFLTVISGKLKVISQDSSSILSEGDTAHYRADCPHCIENLNSQEAEAYLVVMFPKG